MRAPGGTCRAKNKLLFWFEDYALDTDRRELRQGPALLSVEPQVFDLLVFLVRNRDRVVSKDDLLASVWGGRIVSESTLASRINAARRIIGDNGERQRLEQICQVLVGARWQRLRLPGDGRDLFPSWATPILVFNVATSPGAARRSL
jgi:DNA-binding response OmpR family regulator